MIRRLIDEIRTAYRDAKPWFWWTVVVVVIAQGVVIAWSIGALRSWGLR